VNILLDICCCSNMFGLKIAVGGAEKQVAARNRVR